MAMTANESLPTWRNALSWAAIGFVFCGIVMLGAIALLQDGGLGGLFASEEAKLTKALAVMAGSLLLATAVVGFSKRNSPLSARTLRNYLLANLLALAVFALAAWGHDMLVSLAAPGSMDLSATVALILGLVLLTSAILIGLVTAAAHSDAGLVDAEQAEDLRERGRVTLYSAIWLAATGFLLALLSLAGPDGAISPAIALAGSIVLVAIATAASFAMWPLLDELWQALSRESGNAGFYLTVTIGGGWAVVAHLGFVRAPAPLDWLTLLTVIMLAASFIAIGRRGLLKSR